MQLVAQILKCRNYRNCKTYSVKFSTTGDVLRLPDLADGGLGAWIIVHSTLYATSTQGTECPMLVTLLVGVGGRMRASM